MIAKYINKLKEKIQKKKKQKKEEKELFKKMEEEEKELEKELPKEDSFSILEVFSILKSKSEEDIEYESYLTESEKEEERIKQKEEKRLIIIIIIVMISVGTVIGIGTNIMYNIYKPELFKVTEPILRDYYENRYNIKLERKSIEKLSADVNGKKIESDIILLTTKDNKHLVCVNNEQIGDDISISSLKDEGTSYFKGYVDEGNLIFDEIDLSYQDYYIVYNRFLEYINLMPADKSFTELLETGKLTLTYKMAYQNDLDITPYQEVIKKLTNDSKIILFRLDHGIPINVKIITKEKTVDLNINNYKEIEEGITVFDIDRTLNNISEVKLSKIVDSSLDSTSTYELRNGYRIEFDKVKRKNNKDEDKSKYTDYYLVRFSTSILIPNNVVQVNNSKRTDKYEELDKYNYNEAIFVKIGSYTYVLSDKRLFFASKIGKKVGIFG